MIKKLILCKLLNKHSLQPSKKPELVEYSFCKRCGIVDFMTGKQGIKLRREIKRNFRKLG